VHLNVGKYDPDIRPHPKDCDRFVGIPGLHDFKASLFHYSSRIHPEQQLVFDDQNDGLQLLHIMASLPELFSLSFRLPKCISDLSFPYTRPPPYYLSNRHVCRRAPEGAA